MIRSPERYARLDPNAVMGGSDAQAIYFAQDAKRDIGMLAALVQRVANLNPDAGEIGPGMMAQLVTDARRILEANG